MQDQNSPTLRLNQGETICALASGVWLAPAFADQAVMFALENALAQATDYASKPEHPDLHWDLSTLSALDHIGAQLLWRAWGKKYPKKITINPAHLGLFSRLEEVSKLTIRKEPRSSSISLARLGRISLGFVHHVVGMIALLGQLVIDVCRFARHPLKGPWKEISANVYRTGFQALGVTALVGLLIGIVLSYLSAQQLREYGGDLFIVNLLGVSIVRELGPMLAAILIAGRSGSAITAQLGVMRVTEEIDAMRVMGIPIGFRLIMPKVVALAFTMPMIVIWTDVMALIGGMMSAKVILDMSPAFFIHKLADAVSLTNYWIGLGKGVVFGILIALVACHYGMRIKPNTESLGQGTTSSVVVAITAVIIADAIFAIIFSKVGY